METLVPMASWLYIAQSPLCTLPLPHAGTALTCLPFSPRALPTLRHVTVLATGLHQRKSCHWVWQFAQRVHPKPMLIQCVCQREGSEQWWFGKLETDFMIPWQTE